MAKGKTTKQKGAYKRRVAAPISNRRKSPRKLASKPVRRKRAIPEGNPEYVYVMCSKDPSHTDENSHVLREVWDKPNHNGSSCGCGAVLIQRPEDDAIPF